MKAIVITAYGGPEMLSVTELPDPVPAAGEVLIRVRAFGLNHAETYMRSGAWGTVAQVTGIECAGTVEACLDGQVGPGTHILGGVALDGAGILGRAVAHGVTIQEFTGVARPSTW